MIERTPIILIKEVVEEFNKMAFVSGPRQVGKTTLAKRYQEQFEQSLYLNWDNILHQKKSCPILYSSRKKIGIRKNHFCSFLMKSINMPAGKIT